MNLIRWNPTLLPSRELDSVHDEVNRLFGSFLRNSPLSWDGNAVFSPAVDVEETPEDFVFRFDLPGVSQKDVKVSVMGDTLTVRGERKAQSERKDGSLHRAERLHGAFGRSFTLASPVRSDKVQAKFQDGVLEIRVPKAEEARAREVEIQIN